MSNILARVELHGADEDEYETLHQHMLTLGFVRETPHGDGTRNKLPDATYVAPKKGELAPLREKISAFADKLGTRRASVFICEFENCAWYLYRAD
ncbi:hypothetical protein CEO49_22405 [Klebsiella variicola]|uniref:hypothetical protein n=1 Tax=Klebsiella variicola TaxID=244366 RepID=UPI000B9FB987|nr:hypothetical protein [Klebsiella variicola]OZM18070.1 hypothetical protein CEO49_22405 [Klebsiella variicola]